MWAARLLLLAVGAVAFHLPDLSTIAPEKIAERQAEFQRLWKELQEEAQSLSYAEIKTFVPDEIIDFAENLSYDDVQLLQKAAETAVRAMYRLKQKQRSIPDIDLFQYGYSMFTTYIAHYNADLRVRISDLDTWLSARFDGLEKRNQKRFKLLAFGLIAAVKRGTFKLTTVDRAVIEAAKFTIRPIFDKGVEADLVAQFSKLEALFKSDLYDKFKQLYSLVLGNLPPFDNINRN